jgi:hypothetical protein
LNAVRAGGRVADRLPESYRAAGPMRRKRRFIRGSIRHAGHHL